MLSFPEKKITHKFLFNIINNAFIRQRLCKAWAYEQEMLSLFWIEDAQYPLLIIFFSGPISKTTLYSCLTLSCITQSMILKYVIFQYESLTWFLKDPLHMQIQLKLVRNKHWMYITLRRRKKKAALLWYIRIGDNISVDHTVRFQKTLERGGRNKSSPSLGRRVYFWAD